MDEKLDNEQSLNVRHRTDWWANDFKLAYRKVENLRKRIFRATRNNDMKKVRSLQKLMLRSRANILVSVRRATQINQGKVTAGIDRQTALTPVERAKMVNALSNYRAWNPKPAKRVYIPKKNGLKRPLGIPTITDRCIQAMVKNALEPFWEAKFEATSYGFRPARSCHDAQGRIFSNMKSSPQGKPSKKRWIVEGDIKGCFDNISHEFLLKVIGNFPARKLIYHWLKAGYVDKGVFNKTESGTPQGGIISPLLANIALHGLESALGIKYQRKIKNGKEYWENKSLRTLIRYADDFVIMCESKEDALRAKEETELWLKDRGLNLSPEKTKITEASGGFDFLGWNFRHYKVTNTKSGIKTLIKPSPLSIKSVRQSLKDCFEIHRGNELFVLIKDANAIIRGWCEYHRGAVSKETFGQLDDWLYKVQKKWIKRRTPKLANSARASKYWGKFNPERDDKWVFGDKKTGTHMLKFGWMEIQRHELIKFDYSPDNPDLKDYWDKRRNRISRTREKNANSKFYFGILKDQHFVCPVCKQSLVFTDEVRHVHHIIPRDKNGGDDRRNLRYLHAPCHHKVHAIGATSLEAHMLLGLTEKSYAKLERINQEWWAKQSQDKNKKK